MAKKTLFWVGQNKRYLVNPVDALAVHVDPISTVLAVLAVLAVSTT